MALSVPTQSSTPTQLESVRSEEHAQQHRLSPGVVRDSNSDPRLSLGPVAGWGRNGQSVSVDSSSNSVQVRSALDDNSTPQPQQEHISPIQPPNTINSSEPKSENQALVHLNSDPEISRVLIEPVTSHLQQQ